MALVINDVPSPKGASSRSTFGDLRTVLKDITFDQAPPVGGYPLTPAMFDFTCLVGMTQIAGPADPIGGPGDQAGVLISIAPNGQSGTIAPGFTEYPNFWHWATVPATTIAQDTTTGLFVAPYTGKVTACYYIPVSTFTGAATSYRTFSLVNVTETLTPATLVGNLSSVVLTSGVANPITLGTTAAVAVTAKDSFQWTSVHTSSGIIDPGGIVAVGITPTTPPATLAMTLSAALASNLTARFLVLGW
jgi:hypothetical protein